MVHFLLEKLHRGRRCYSAGKALYRERKVFGATDVHLPITPHRRRMNRFVSPSAFRVWASKCIKRCTRAEEEMLSIRSLPMDEGWILCPGFLFLSHSHCHDGRSREVVNSSPKLYDPLLLYWIGLPVLMEDIDTDWTYIIACKRLFSLAFRKMPQRHSFVCGICLLLFLLSRDDAETLFKRNGIGSL